MMEKKKGSKKKTMDTQQGTISAALSTPPSTPNQGERKTPQTSISKESDESSDERFETKSSSDESHETEELRIQGLRERAEDEALTYIFQNEKCLEEDSLFYPMYEATVHDGEYYAYCLVDSNSYKRYGVENFEAFIRSVRYIGKGRGSRGLLHSFERTKNVNKISKCQKMWENGAKVTTVCLTFYSEKRALQVEALMLEAFGTKFKYKEHLKKEYRRPHKQLWNCKWEHYKGLPILEDAKKKELGVQLLHTAWKVYVDKPVVLEMMLSHPYSDAIRIDGKKVNLLKAAQEVCDEAEKQYQDASRKIEAASIQSQATKEQSDKTISKCHELLKCIFEQWKPYFAKMQSANLIENCILQIEKTHRLKEVVDQQVEDGNGVLEALRSEQGKDLAENIVDAMILHQLLEDEITAKEDCVEAIKRLNTADRAFNLAKKQLNKANCCKKQLLDSELFNHT